MSDSHRRDRGAFVALGLILAAILLLAVLTRPGDAFHSQVANPNGQSEQNGSGQDRPAEPNLWPQFAPLDTYAQWVMAALALIATGVSIVGVRWIRDTLIETRRTANAALEANETARDIGQKQVAAYLSISSAEFGVSDNACWVKIRVKNFGQSPARWSRVSGTLVVPAPIGQMPVLEYLPMGRNGTGPIISGTEEWTLLNATGGYGSVPEGVIGRYFNSPFPLIIDALLEWEDVFGRVEALHLTLMEDTDRTTREPTPLGKGMVKKGWLTPSTTDPSGRRDQA